MIPLIGYTDRLSIRPGQTIAFKVSSQGPDPVEARLLRVICADPNPAGPGILEQPVPAHCAGSYPSRVQPIYAGSYGRIADPAPLRSLANVTFVATIWPTTPNTGEQGILSHFDPATGTGLALAIGRDGSATAILGRGSGTAVRISAGQALKTRTWYRVWASLDRTNGRVRVGQAPVQSNPFAELSGSNEVDLDVDVASHSDGPLLIAALGGDPIGGHFNGKIEAPAVFGRVLEATEITTAAAGDENEGLVARWDFSKEISSSRIIDIGLNGLDGEIVNLPARAMTGSSWCGQEMCWRHAPEREVDPPAGNKQRR